MGKSNKKKKIAYLTIDDGPSEDMRMKVDYLYSKKIPAVWFCQGNFLEKRPELAVYAIKKGFIIGNHSYNHPYFSQIKLDECFVQILKTDKIINHIYHRAGIKRSVKFFRFPCGDKGGMKHADVFSGYSNSGQARKDRIQEYLKQLGYSQPSFKNITYKYYRKAGLLSDVDWHWTYDVMEWGIYFRPHPFGINSLGKVFARMEENKPEGCRGLNDSKSAEIILLHDFSQSSDILIPIVERLLAKGIEFKSPLIR